MTHSFISILVYALIHTILQQELKPPLEGHPSNSGKPQDDKLLKSKSYSFHILSGRENTHTTVSLVHVFQLVHDSEIESKTFQRSLWRVDWMSVAKLWHMSRMP